MATKIQYVVVVRTTGEQICVEDSLKEAMNTINAVAGLDIRVKITHTEVSPLNN